MFITHDFGVVAEIADRVAVMRQGKLVEQGQASDVLLRPQHDYTRALDRRRAEPHAAPRPAQSAPAQSAEALAPVGVGRGEDLCRPAAAAFRSAGSGCSAVAGVSLEMPKGRSLALVGEFGFGQIHARALHCGAGAARQRAPSCSRGRDIAGLSRAKLRPYRKALQMIFQDPFASLNPRWRVADIIAQGPIINGTPRKMALGQAAELLRLVGLDPKAADRYPHEFSGGQRQRIGIARALAVKPKLIIADEPVSALDVSVQKQVLDLLDELRTAFDLSMLFITHDLRVAAHVCEEIAVMKDGVIVEHGATADIFAEPRHEYTKTLLASVPGRDWQLRISAARN